METKKGCPVLRVKQFGENGEFSGYGSVFGNVDDYGDIVMPGAFSRTLKEHISRGSMPKLFWQHSMSEPIGSWVEMSEDDTGLFVKGRLNMGVQRGREAYALLKGGDIDGLSIGYRVRKSTWNEDDETLALDDIDLLEVSVVSIGANDKALVAEVKAKKQTENFEARLRAGEQPTVRDWEKYWRSRGFSKSEAERTVRCVLKSGRGDPDTTERAFWQAMRA